MKHGHLVNFGIFTLLMVGAIHAGPAHAESWSPILICENGTAVVDVNTEERRQLQLVFHGYDLLSRMKNAGVAWPSFGDQSYVIRGEHAELRQISPTATMPQSLGGVFYPYDFKKMIVEAIGYSASAFEIEPRGTDLVIKKLLVTQGTSCTGEFEGECQGAVFHKTYYFQGDYVLRGCVRQ